MRPRQVSGYNVRVDIDLQQLPIPDWGLVCPRCSYPLKGLPSHRCPECGLRVKIPDLVRTWTRLRAPLFTGNELPVPDFGLACEGCRQPLAGARDFKCPHCDRPFDLTALRPPEEWFILDSRLCGDLPVAGVQPLLAAEAVPYVQVDEKTATEIYFGPPVLTNRLRVPTEFYFDIIWLLRRSRQEVEAARAGGGNDHWLCRKCGEENPANFDVCWSCQKVKSP